MINVFKPGMIVRAKYLSKIGVINSITKGNRIKVIFSEKIYFRSFMEHELEIIRINRKK